MDHRSIIIGLLAMLYLHVRVSWGSFGYTPLLRTSHQEKRSIIPPLPYDGICPLKSAQIVLEECSKSAQIVLLPLPYDRAQDSPNSAPPPVR